MSNILIIKHGSLGDLIQANGAMEDIKKSHIKSKVLLLTSLNYSHLMSQCPYLDGVLIDKREPRWNLVYLFKLKKVLDKYNFTHVYDLQNSSRTKFYSKFLLRNAIWSSTDTSLEAGQKKSDFDMEPVLERMEVQLKKSGVKTVNTKKANLSWALTDIKNLTNRFFKGNYILIFPFCSKKHIKKKWPYYRELIDELKRSFKNYEVAIAPGYGEIEDSRKFNAHIILDKNNILDLNQLISLINNSSFVISNDTGPAHICSHLDKRGLVLFGSHTTAKKVSIETTYLKTLSVENLNELDVSTVLEHVKKNLNQF